MFVDYMIDTTFRNIDRLSALSFKLGKNMATRNIFKHYLPLVEIKDFDALIANKSVFNPQKADKKRIKNLSNVEKQ